ncbi:MAG: acetyl-CoA carboxylase biotin carboxyl carrier protein subunit [Ectothiorhodospiraceae bacterium]|nr:acetyl-CoA carboxylase biotin carboxyl carrier protein subunit [Chromatiales bacterium]MCP5154048.1 acetyl-CoA carboxylase biotin carboxyl carrier protein subunit [Ectothiorhodospiraceae bacterium]
MDAVAEVTGVVFSILVEVGETVDEGHELMILESMKMEVPVYAPAAGTVSSIRFDEGEVVEQGAVVAILTTG